MSKATPSMMKSWEQDKAVQDNIVESWLCIDCGINTHPGCSSGPELRIAFAMGAESDTVRFDNNTEVYSVKDAIWKQAGMRPWKGCLCIGCIEQRLGRQLRPRDFARHDQTWAQLPCTDRLLDRRGYRKFKAMTKDGVKEFITDKASADKLARALPPGELPYLEDCA